MKKVDVIIPSYKRPKLTCEALKSVLNQTYTHLNVIVIEDGSKQCATLIQKIINEDNRIQYISLFTNRGVSYTRNLGASLGHNEFIAFLDSDDIWHKDKLKYQLEFFNKHNDIKWGHCNEEWYKNGTLLKQKKNIANKEEYLSKNLWKDV